jgi:DNA-binding XRE family transcriptional regulator
MVNERKRNVAKNFHELRKRMPPEAQKKARVLAQKYTEEMPLDELRAARQMTQEHLARLLGTKQAAISKMERRTDMYLSTLQSIVKAMGGRLRIEAVFAEGAVEINQFRRLRKSKIRAKTRTSSGSKNER